MLTLTLPLPPAEFSLNSRRHWTIKEKVRLEAQSAGKRKGRPTNETA